MKTEKFDKKALFSNVAESLYKKVLDLVENPSEEGFQKPWYSGDKGLRKAGRGFIHYNIFSLREYTGFVNNILLEYEKEFKGYNRNAWLTFLQVKNLGGNIKKGEKAAHVYKFILNIYNKQGEKITPKDFKGYSDQEKKECKIFPRYSEIPVFNVCQTENLPSEYYEIEASKLELFDNNKAELLKNEIFRFIPVTHANIDSAYYASKMHVINLPLRENFISQEHYFSVLFHEVTHSTGHKDLLNRESLVDYKKHRALEELTAELGAAFLCGFCGITKTFKGSCEYLRSWLTGYENDKEFFIKAVMQAETAVSFLMNTLNVSFENQEEETQAA